MEDDFLENLRPHLSLIQTPSRHVSTLLLPSTMTREKQKQRCLYIYGNISGPITHRT